MADPAVPNPSPFSDLPMMVKLKYLIEALRNGKVGVGIPQATDPTKKEAVSGNPLYAGQTPQQIADGMSQ